MGEYREDWSPAQREVRSVVKLKGATVQKSFQMALGPTARTYQVDQVEVTWRWRTGEDPADRPPIVRLECREVWGKTLLAVRTFYPPDLDEVPDWLDSIITRSQPVLD